MVEAGAHNEHRRGGREDEDAVEPLSQVAKARLPRRDIDEATTHHLLALGKQQLLCVEHDKVDPVVSQKQLVHR